MTTSFSRDTHWCFFEISKFSLASWHLDTYLLFQVPPPCRAWQNIEYTSLLYPAGSCWSNVNFFIQASSKHSGMFWDDFPSCAAWGGWAGVEPGFLHTEDQQKRGLCLTVLEGPHPPSAVLSLANPRTLVPGDVSRGSQLWLLMVCAFLPSCALLMVTRSRSW